MAKFAMIRDDDPNALQHFKYVSRKRVGDKWVYEYPNDKKNESAASKALKKDKKYQSHRGALENYEQRGAKNSRNMPGGNTDSNGKSFIENPNRMSIKQIKDAKKAGAAVKAEKARKEKEKLRAHAYTLEYKQRQNAVSRNIPSQQNTSKPANTLTKRDIKKAVFKSKLSVAKREAREAIDRAKKWLSNLFD